jgi:hypothetical protein|tara:strand:- start:9586 stop:9894 length:309 start_codon:yes stop_codon:yes gene_type:complete
MEIVDLLSYYIYEDTKRMEVSFRLSIDSEDEMRSDVINLDESKEYGYSIVEENLDFFDLSDYEDEEFEDYEDFQSVDEDILIQFLNEYYIVNTDKLPKPEFI